RLFNALRADASRRLQQDTGKLVGTTMSGLQSIETLKASGGEADYYTKWIGNFGKVINAEQRLGLTDRVLGIFPKLTESINVTAVLVVGSLRVMDGNMSMGTVIAFYYLLANFLAPVARFVQVGSMLQTAEADLSRIDDVMRYTPQRGLGMNEAALTDEQESNVLSSTVAPSSKLSGAVEVRGLSFGYYSLGRPLIKELDLSLEPGSRTALVGGSGSGKSTIAKLVCNLHQPWSGDILFDGQPRTNIARDMLSRSLALVDQEIMVYQGTVRDNVCLWDPTLPETSIVRACRDACIHDEIMSRPGGYDSPISEGGTNFSGGQLQRLELARALANDPSILVLDEATSALDTHSEMQVMENLRRRGCTVLLVSHRLSAIRDCDEIIVLKFGEIAERGSHRDLVSADGHYVELLGAA
ncbi:ATP-binding cassette domain-containing protein, partial [bacterium]|nr:ATP-binding cassette domain-containing protein [bacterium]